jgi:hypothetical protein
MYAWPTPLSKDGYMVFKGNLFRIIGGPNSILLSYLNESIYDSVQLFVHPLLSFKVARYEF